MNGSRSTFLYLLAAAGLARHPRPRPTGATTWSPGSTSCTTTPARIAADRQKPAFLCSGVLFRATWPSTDYMFYSISPKSQKSGGVSASYLRKDAKYRKLAYGLKSGFIFDTIFGNPKDHQDYSVLCSFPIDAATDDRAQQGCTDSRRTPNSVESPARTSTSAPPSSGRRTTGRTAATIRGSAPSTSATSAIPPPARPSTRASGRWRRSPTNPSPPRTNCAWPSGRKTRRSRRRSSPRSTPRTPAWRRSAQPDPVVPVGPGIPPDHQHATAADPPAGRAVRLRRA